MKHIFAFLFCLFAINGFTQDKNNFEISDKLELPRYGWNKVLQTRNGNTILIHLENEKGIIVKIFDKERKEIVSRKQIVKCLDFFNVEMPEFKGLYNINNEAVLFIQHIVDNKKSLIRFRFNTDDGKLIEEKTLVQSVGFGNKTFSYVLKEKNSDNYSVFCYRNVTKHASDDLELIRYNAGHEIIKKITLDTHKKDYEHMGLGGVTITSVGDICITINWENNKVQSSRSSRSTYFRDLGIYYLPHDADHFTSIMTKIDDDVYIYRTIVTENTASKRLNLVLLSSGNVKYNSYSNSVVELKSYSLVVSEDGLSEIKRSMVTYNTIRDYLRRNVDSIGNFYGIPVKMHTNDSGVTTIVSEEYYSSNEIGNGYNSPNTILGYVGLTQYNNMGEEISAVLLPKTQYVARTQARISANDYVGQFASVNCRNLNDIFYVFYNDNRQNYNNSVDSPGIPVYDGFHQDAFTYTDAFYYRVDQHLEMQKKYLFGPPLKNESKFCDLASPDLDDKTNTYAIVMLDRDGTKITAHLAWCHLE